MLGKRSDCLQACVEHPRTIRRGSRSFQYHVFKMRNLSYFILIIGNIKKLRLLKCHIENSTEKMLGAFNLHEISAMIRKFNLQNQADAISMWRSHESDSHNHTFQFFIIFKRGQLRAASELSTRSLAEEFVV